MSLRVTIGATLGPAVIFVISLFISESVTMGGLGVLFSLVILVLLLTLSGFYLSDVQV